MRGVHKKLPSRFTLNHLLIVALAALVSIQVMITNKIATSGRELSDLAQKALVLEQQNNRILSQNVESMSLYELSQKAVEMGFIEPEEVVNLDKSAEEMAVR